MRRSIVAFLCSLLALAGLVALGHWHWHVTSSRKEIDTRLRQRLVQLGARALRSRDVPVACIILYGDSMLGIGYNTVLSDSDAGGHAEINALSSALRHVGPRAFGRLNRDSLLLLTTFEPCPMCRGAILEYGIRRVVFLKGKPLMQRIREDVAAFRYEWRRTQQEPSSLQDTLFRRHPDFQGPHGRSRRASSQTR